MFYKHCHDKTLIVIEFVFAFGGRSDMIPVRTDRSIEVQVLKRYSGRSVNNFVQERLSHLRNILTVNHS